MQTNEFGYLVHGAKGLFYSDGRYFYFPNRDSNLKEGIIKNIRVVKDFLDDRGYAFIDAEMVETEPFSDKELLKMMSWSSNVRRFKLGDSEVVLAFESGGLSDFNMFSKDLSSSGKVSAYIMHDDELVWIAQESEPRYFAREPFRTFLRLAEPLDAKLFHGYCKSHFAGSELHNKLALLKASGDSMTFFDKTDFYINTELGIVKKEAFYEYAHSSTVKYYMYNGEKLLETYKDLDALGSVPFKKVEQKTIRAYAQELHINLSAHSYESCCISDALSSKLFELGSNHYLVYAYNVDTVNVKALQDKKLNELVTQTSEDYLSELKRYARNLTAKNIGSMTLQSWYFKQ